MQAVVVGVLDIVGHFNKKENINKHKQNTHTNTNTTHTHKKNKSHRSLDDLFDH